MIGKMKFAAGYLGLGLFLAACNGGGGDGGTAPTSAELIGKWLLRDVATSGRISMNFPPFVMDTTWDTTESYTGSTYYMDFKADNSYQSNMPESDMPGGLEKRGANLALESGTWSLDGKVLTMVAAPEMDTMKMNVTLDGGTLTAKFSMDTSFSDEQGSMSTRMDMTAKLVK